MSMLIRRSAQLARAAPRLTFGRSISSSPVSRKDFVQDLYVNELRSYKAPPAAKDAHVGAVKNFNAPAAPEPPALPTDLASELAAYDAAEPVAANAAHTKVPSATEDASATGAEAYLAFLEQDLPKPVAHH